MFFRCSHWLQVTLAISSLSHFAYAQQCPSPATLPSNYRITSSAMDIANNGELQLNPLFYYVRVGDKEGLIDKDGSIIVEPNKYNSIGFFSNDIATVEIGGKMGYIDITGKEIIAPQYQSTEYFKEGVAGVAEKKDIATQLIDKEGNVLLQGDFEYIDSYGDGRVVVYKDGKYGLLDYQGKVIVEPQYTYMNSFHQNGLMIVGNDDLMGAIDRDGKVVIEPKYSLLFPATTGFIAFMEKDGNDQAGIISLTGEPMIPFEYEGFLNYEESLSIEGEVPSDFDQLFYHDVIVAQKNDKYGLINSKNQAVLPFEYDYLLFVPNNDLLIATKDQKMGLIDFQGKEIIAFDQYDSLEFDSKGLLLTYKEVPNEKSEKNDATKQILGVADLSGKVVFEPQYEELTILNQNLFLVKTAGDEYSHLINAQSDTIGDTKWRYFINRDIEGGLILLTEAHGNDALLDAQGNILLSPRYPSLEYVKDNKFIASNKDRTLLIDGKGCVLIETDGKWKK